MLLLDCLVYSRSKLSGPEPPVRCGWGSFICTQCGQSNPKVPGLTSKALENTFSKTVKQAQWL